MAQWMDCQRRLKPAPLVKSRQNQRLTVTEWAGDMGAPPRIGGEVCSHAPNNQTNSPDTRMNAGGGLPAREQVQDIE